MYFISGNSESCYFPAICKEHSRWIKLTDVRNKNQIIIIFIKNFISKMISIIFNKCVRSACETELNGIQGSY